ncbi:hypothetical protein FHG66_03960 [Rubellimicrobium rubrum]|uniref:ParB/Sulfiredoxin domain-containing protein n=2 Tax=Rubellimicrobium rubrum TaxID=2585369 RepID=A0A5C4N2L8_9RHOB|nr:hypothetical protein FHG66_03960 [Rubellimicrobium rubrum]
MAVADGEAARGAVRDELWLLGQPPLRDYLDFVRRLVVDGASLDPRALTDKWREANDRYYELERTEAGVADKAGRRPLPKAMRSLAESVSQTAHFRRTFDSLPVTIEMVQLDRLVVYQPHVTLPFTERLQAQVDPGMDAEALFRFCHPVERRDPPVRARRIDDKRYLFTSDSTDFRLHDPALLRPDQIVEHDSFGPISAAIGLMVGYGSNFLSVIRSDSRMLLHNGYHRAYALRAAGITHAPAVVQTVTRRDELQLVASAVVVDEPAFFFASKRPPLLKDFFDPKIARVLPVKRMEKMIEVSFEIREYDVPCA